MAIEDALKILANEHWIHADEKIRIQQALEKPREMLPYNDSCKPEKSGKYWYASSDMDEPKLFDYCEGLGFFGVSNYLIRPPKHWLPLEPTPIIPEDKKP